MVEASLPGVRSENALITAMGDTLTIRSSTKKEEREEGYMQQERYQGEMSRTSTLPTQIDPEKVEARYEQGVLTLHIPKSEATKQKQIVIKATQAVGAQ